MDTKRRINESQADYELRVLHGRRLGAIIVPPDPRLPKLPRVTAQEAAALPASVDLRPYCSAIKDQGQLGSCVACCWASGFEWLQKKLLPSVYFAGSRLALYKWARDHDGTTGDVGTTDQSMNQVVTQTGVAHESLWPYTISQFDVEPPANVKTDAAKAKATATHTVDANLTQLKSTLSGNLPVMFTFFVYQGYEDATSHGGHIGMPSGNPFGGHCNLLVGYNDASANRDGSSGAFIVQNSWGVSWGASGFGYMPYGYANGEIATCYVISAESEIIIAPPPPEGGTGTPVKYGAITGKGAVNLTGIVRVREYQPGLR